jgi:hypothetical protein
MRAADALPHPPRQRKLIQPARHNIMDTPAVGENREVFA